MPVSTSDIDITESYPIIRPSLNLNFARSRALDNRITFTRGSSATYVGRDGLIKTAGNNEPRFDHDPDTLESLGLLIEESRTNQHGNHDFSSGWALNNSSFTTGISDPEGGTNARKLVVGGATNGTAACFITDNTSLTNGTTYTQSLWAKANVAGNFYSVVQIAPSTGFTQAYRNFNLSNGTLGSGDIPESDCKIEKYPNGWYRVSVTRTATSTISGRMAIAIVDSPTSGRLASISTGSANNDGIYIWGVQLEVGLYPTSLIRTTGSSETRAQDATKLMGENFKSVFDTSFPEFSTVMDYNNIETVKTGLSNGVFIMWGESTNFDNRLSVSSDNDAVNTAVRVRAFGGGSAIFSNNDQVEASSQAATQKFAFSYSVPNYGASGTRKWAFSFSGEAVDLITNNNGSTIPSWTRLGIGINPTRNDESGGKLHVKRLAIYPKALTDAQLQLLSS